ncbi:MAG: hypothetical protein DYG88_03590 [Chloroflexi bacterium CFX4]|nr:hypothetical protein [Chloroflexi bacterium CFX4]MDL1921148.1 hypothetical protein [Chloroflexi bacterium CFX3]
MSRKIFSLFVGVALLISTAASSPAQAEDFAPHSGDWRAYPLEGTGEYVFRNVLPLYTEPAVPLPITVSDDGESLQFVINGVSVYEEYLDTPIQGTLERVEGGYVSDQIVLDEVDYSRSYSIFSLVMISPTRAILTESFTGFEVQQTRTWLLTFGEDEDDPREALFRCEGNAPSRLVVGLRVVVVGETPNNVRAAPARTANRLFQVPPYLNLGVREEEAVLKVLEGPICGDGFAWWRVQFGTREGWTAEGDAESYFLEIFEEDRGLADDLVLQQLKDSAPPSR